MDKRRQLLEKMLQEKQNKSASQNKIENANSATPLTFAQERLWFLDQMDPGNAAYNIAVSTTLTGNLKINNFLKAYQQTVDLHTALRTFFSFENGILSQHILEDVSETIEFLNIQQKSDSEIESEVLHQKLQLAKTAFDLQNGPLVKSLLIQKSDTEFEWILVMHHIISDAVSFSVFLKDFSAFYNDLNCKFSRPQFGEFAKKERESSNSKRIENQLDYWKTQLAGNLPQLDLKFQKPKQKHTPFEGDQLRLSIPKLLIETLERISKAEQITPFMLFLSAYQLLIMRIEQSDECIVGTTFSSRMNESQQNVIGFFQNTLAIRAKIDTADTLTTYLKNMRKTILDAFDHQDVPFGQLVAMLQPERNVDRNPIFQTAFLFQQFSEETSWRSALNLPNIEATVEQYGSENAKFELTLGIEVRENDDWQLFLEYQKKYYSHTQIQMIGNAFINLLHSIAANSTAKLNELQLLSSTEINELVKIGSGAELQIAKPHSLHQRFETVVKQYPQKTAIFDQTTEISYLHLNTFANQISRLLHEKGAKAGDKIGICLPRKHSLIAGILGILKIGASYVPLDPNYPTERNLYILKDADIQLLLVDAEIVDFNIETVQQIEIQNISANEQHQFASVTVEPNCLAYLIYTSGSTGNPKAVMISHFNALAMIDWAKTVFSAEEWSGVLASTSVCFDLSVFEIFGTLCNGGSIILSENAPLVSELHFKEKVKLVNTVPSAATELLRKSAFPKSLITLNLAGEFLSEELVTELYENTSIQKIYDLYGPSEDTTYSTVALRKANRAATIGKPIANTQVWILDENKQLLPKGALGELYLSGAGVTQGYLNQLKLTAEKFVNIQIGNNNYHAYKTGDLAQWMDNGQLAYLGRKDYQVKVRGYRIELGEIEVALTKHSHISQAVASVVDANDSKSLTAHVVWTATENFRVSEIRRFLRISLPDFMIPNTFIPIQEMPLTQNGKIDRNAIAMLNAIKTEEMQSYHRKTKLEKRIATIWCDLIKISSIDRFANFFDLGGHSLLAMQFIDQIDREYKIKLSPRDILLQNLSQIALKCEVSTSEKIQETEVKQSDDSLVTRFKNIFNR